MSIFVSRRDAIKGAMAATAAIAAAPYLGNPLGGVQASPTAAAPKPTAAPANPAATSSSLSGETTVLYIKGDVVKSFSGLQTIQIQDAVLASRLKGAVRARFE